MFVGFLIKYVGLSNGVLQGVVVFFNMAICRRFVILEIKVDELSTFGWSPIKGFTQDTKFEIYQTCLGKLVHKSDDSINFLPFHAC